MNLPKFEDASVYERFVALPIDVQPSAASSAVTPEAAATVAIVHPYH